MSCKIQHKEQCIEAMKKFQAARLLLDNLLSLETNDGRTGYNCETILDVLTAADIFKNTTKILAAEMFAMQMCELDKGLLESKLIFEQMALNSAELCAVTLEKCMEVLSEVEVTTKGALFGDARTN